MELSLVILGKFAELKLMFINMSLLSNQQTLMTINASLLWYMYLDIATVATELGHLNLTTYAGSYS